jgi:hypothetical protein
VSELSTGEAVTSLTHILIKPCLSEYPVNVIVHSRTRTG